MKKTAIFLLLTSLCFSDNTHKKAGESAASFLKINPDVRGSALGGVYTGLSTGIGALYGNPAALRKIRKREATFIHNEYFEGINQESLCYIHPTKDRTIGIGISGLFTELPRKTKLNTENEGTFRAADYYFIISSGQKVKENLSGGLSLKIIRQEIESQKAAGIGIDASMLYNLRRGLNIGLSLQNIGPGMKIYKERFPLPAIFRVGVGYHLNNLLIVSDIEKPYDNKIILHLGSEYQIARIVSLRAGYSTKEETGFVYGLGFAFKDFKIDYAFIPYNRLSDTHQISLTKGF